MLECRVQNLSHQVHTALAPAREKRSSDDLVKRVAEKSPFFANSLNNFSKHTESFILLEVG